MSDAYLEFLREKMCLARFSGFDVPLEQINPALKPHTRDIVRWMVKGGSRACFARFGLHKTATQLEFLRLIGTRHSDAYRLQVLPLGVRQEFFREARERFTGEFAGLLEAVDTLLETAPCDCSHKRRYERGEHLSGCYLFDLNHARNGCKVCGTGGVVGTEATSHKEPREAAFAAPSSAYPSTALCATCGRTWGCHWGRCCDEEPGTDDRRFVHAPDGVRVLGQQEESPEDADGGGR